MRHKLYWLLLLILFCTLIISGCSPNKTKRTLTATGKLENPVTAITAPRSGKVLGLILEKGDRIRKDEPLFAIAQKEQDAGVEKATVELTKAEAELKNAKGGASAIQIAAARGAAANAEISVTQARELQTKMERLYQVGGIAKQKLDLSRENLAAAEATQAAAQERLQQLTTKATPEAIKSLETKVQQLKTAYEAETKKQTANEIHAPSTCLVTDILVKNGSEAAEGQTVMSVRSLTDATIRARLSSLPSTAALKPGLKVQLTSKNSPKAFEGTLTSVQDGTILVTTTNKPEDLRDGTEVTITLIIE